MAVSGLHRRVAGVILQAAGTDFKLALAGGNALMLRGVIDRKTSDVDVFYADSEEKTDAAARRVEEALLDAGFKIDSADSTAMCSWKISDPATGESTQVELAPFHWLDDPEPVAGIGPVLSLDDLAGWKTHAAATRFAVRDTVDLAALLMTYSPDELIGLARELVPGLCAWEFGLIGRRIDRTADERLAAYLPDPGTVAWIRTQLSGWPRALFEDSRSYLVKGASPALAAQCLAACPGTAGNETAADGGDGAVIGGKAMNLLEAHGVIDEDGYLVHDGAEYEIAELPPAGAVPGA